MKRLADAYYQSVRGGSFSAPAAAAESVGRRRAFIALAQRRARPGSGTHRDLLTRRTFRRSIVDLRRIIKRTPFVVVGAVAARLYMPERSTADVDVLVHIGDAEQAHAELRQAGAVLRGDLSIGGSSWVLPDGTDLDVVESQEPWVRAALEHSRPGPDGQPYVDLPYLVVMKLTASRAQDLADVSRMVALADDRTLGRVRAAVRQHMPDAVQDLESLIKLGKLEMDDQRGPDA